MGWRYIAQRATTGEMLHLDVPIVRDELSWALSGPGGLRGTISPDVGALRAADGRLVLDEWGTLLYAEADGEIRWGGTVVRSRFEGSAWSVEAVGMAGYPHGLPYLGEYISEGVDPLDVVRELWAHVQGQPDGDLGIVVDSMTTPVRVGTVDEPYTLVWWESTDCGTEIDTLARETPFDYTEHHQWDGDSITHRLVIGYPRLGRRRDDLSFEQGVNITNVVAPTRDGDQYANELIGLGAGEGRAVVQRRIPEPDGRLRRAAVYSDKSITSTDRMDALCRAELAVRKQITEIAEVTVINHPHAPIGSWAVGDDVLIKARIPWLGDVSLWHRIVGWSLVSDHRARLSLRRSDAFTYRGTS
ncbi:hypothetical protein [Micromonospora sp. NPDC049204]|uniref:hypothetical protein n=1 Tax=Micromonospora sp. NPDC049204 TaxID=3154351 RepID=UPI0033E6A877